MKSRIKIHFCRPTTIKVSYKFKKRIHMETSYPPKQNENL